jgi:hypothetical protein
MKTPLLTRALWPAAWLVSGLTLFAAQTTTYQVDMSVQIALGNFNPATDTVFVSGNFSTPNWQQTATDGSTNNILTPSGGDPNVYVGTFDDAVAVGAAENHKFVMNPGGSFSALGWESIADRTFQVPSGLTNLPVVYFNNVSNTTSLVTTPITFQVDLSVQMALGKFDPATDFAFVSGDAVNNWSETASQLTQSQVDTNLWEGTFDITDTVGATVNYKYIMNTFLGGVTWENNTVGPGGTQNRQFVFPSTATTLPAVYFNNVSNAASLVVVPVTFEVNMIVQNALGNFTPGLDTVYVAGDAINNWAADASQLAQSMSDPNVYSGAFNVTNVVGTPVNYKFELNSGVLWENDPNRTFPTPSVASNLPSVYFNNVANLGALSISSSGAGQATLHWTAGTRVRLQNTPSLTGVWADVPNTEGSNSVVTNLPGFYRLIGP